jgi:DNA-binding NarL/FixJ family response regulator
VLVLTTFGEDEVLWGAIEAGAAGFVLKDSSAEDLIAAVRAVAEGAAWFDPAVAPRVLDRYRQVVAPAARDAARLDLLTDREHDVLRLMARGATNAEIAGSLHVAEATVKTHVGSIFGKLGVRDRAAAIVFAYDHGVVTPGANP